MGMIKTVLWVEDTATYDFMEAATVARMDGHFDLVIADNITEALAAIREREFDVIIADIRLPPGADPDWISLFEEHDNNRIRAKLGLHFLYAILGHKDAAMPLTEIPSWLSPHRVGVMTVEREGQLGDLKALGISQYRHKRAGTSEDALVQLIWAILNQSNHKAGKKS